MSPSNEPGCAARDAEQTIVAIVLANAGSAHAFLDNALASSDAQDVKRNIDTARRILAALEPVLAQIEAGTNRLKQAAAAKMQLQERLCEIEEIVSY
jgi:hypothetical protein